MKGLTLKLIYTSLLVLFFCLIAGCNSQTLEKPTNSVSNKEFLSFRLTWKAYSGRGEAIQKIVNSYNEQSKDKYEIKLTNGDEDMNVLAKLLKNDTQVDIYVLPYRYVKYFGNKGELLDLTKDFEAEKAFFHQNLWDLGMVGERTYGIPWLGHSIALIYNQNLLQKAGVDPRSINSIQQLVAACEQVEANTAAKGIGLVGANHNDLSWMVNQFVYSFGSRLVNEDCSKVAVNNEKARAAIEFYKNNLGPHAQATWVDDTGIEVMNYFRKQAVAFEFQGPWGVTDIWKSGNPFGVGVIALDSVGLYSEVGPMMLALPANIREDKKAAALNFIHFLISKTAQEKIMDGEYSPEHDAYYPFRIPARKDLANSLFFTRHPEFIPFMEGFNNPSIDVPVPQWQIIKDQYYAPGLHLLMGDKLPVDVFLNNIEVEGNKILMVKEQ